MDPKGRFALLVSFGVALGAACSAGQEKGTTGGDGGVHPDSGTVTLPDGNVVLPDGAPVEDTGTNPDDTGTAPDTDPGADTGAPPPTDTGVSPDGAVPVTYNLVITPKDTTVMLPAGAATAALPYYASLVSTVAYDPPIDVTASTTFTIDDPTFGTFAGTTLTYGKTGNTAVRAKHSTYNASTYLTITGPQTVVASGAPAGADGKFGGAVDATVAPTMVYPADGVILPPNMNVFEFQFLPGAGNNLFELAFKGTNLDLKVYFTCTTVGSGCGYKPDATVWKYLAEGGRGQAPVTYTLRGTNTTTGKVGAAAARKLSFALENIVGGIYYWNAGAGSTMRYEFGVSGASAETWMNTAKAGGTTCVGCHELSRRGHRVALGLDIPAPSVWKTFDVATRTLVFKGPQNANFYAFSPDEAQVVSSDGATLVLRNATNGASLGKIGQNGTQPNWSADGKHIVYARHNNSCAGALCGTTGNTQGHISLIDWSGSAWVNGATLVSYSGKNNFYPSFAPEGDFVVFNQSPSNRSSYDAWDAQVWAVPTGGGAAVRLANASTGGDSWPKPYVESQRHRNGGKLVWVTFSSRRSYGLRLINPTPPPADPEKPEGTAQIWMTAIDPAKIAAGQDGSYPSFWVPFQDIGSGNHIAQWVKKVERLTCATGNVCQPGESCVNNQCVGGIK